MIEAPRGTLIHHYKVNPEGAITWANLIVATGHNNLAIGSGVQQVSKHFIDGAKLNESMLNHVSALGRAYDPCLSFSTHAFWATRSANPPGRSSRTNPRSALYRLTVDAHLAAFWRP